MFPVYIVPGLGERAESLGSVMVIGDAFKKNVAFPVLLEEALHGLFASGPITSEKYAIKTKDEALREEVLIGYLLHQLLTFIHYNKEVSDSVVFGWQNGRRKKLVEALLKISGNC